MLNKNIFFLSMCLIGITPHTYADSKGDWYVGAGIPFQGIGFYKQKDHRVSVWNLTPFSLEHSLANNLGARFSIYTVYSTPTPKQIKEFEFNFEFPYYFYQTNSQLELSGYYVGPMLMLQHHDQDTGASLGGPGITLGYRGDFSDRYWYRVGCYLAYHTYLYGPKAELLAINNGSESGGLFMGLTLFEVGATF